MTVPVKVPLDRLAAVIDSLLSSQKNGVFFVSGQPIADGVTLQMGLHRSGPTTVGSEGGTLVLSAPLTVDDGQVEAEKRLGPLTVRAHARFAASLSVAVRIKLSVSRYWNLVANVEPSFSWIEDPTVRVSLPALADLEFGVSPFVTPQVNQRLAALAEQAKTFVAAVPLRATVEELWRQIQVPVRLPGDEPAYLVLAPTTASVSEFRVEGEKLVVRPRVTGVLKVQLSSTPPTARQVPLPANGDAPGDGFEANVVASASFAELRVLANRRLKGQEFALAEGAKVRPRVITLSSAGSRLVLAMDFDADLPGLFRSARGRLYVWASPVYDEAAKRLAFTHLEFVETTDNALVSVADALAHRSWLKQLEKQLTFDLAPRLDPLVRGLTSTPIRTTLAPGVEFELTFEKLAVHGLTVTESGVSVVVTGAGRAAVTVDPTSFFGAP